MTERQIKVLLIYPPVRLTKSARIPPLGYLYLAVVLEQAGIQVEILDLNLLRLPIAEVMSEIRKRQFDVIGIGGMTTIYYYMKMLSLLIKEEFPHIPIIGGGSACSATPETVLKNTGVDIACIGEGEPIIVDLVQRLVKRQPISDIGGIVYKDADGKIIKTLDRGRLLEQLPYPAYHLVDMDRYISNNKLKYHESPLLKQMIKERGLDREAALRPVYLFSKRGCPFGCNFCYRNFGRKVVFSEVDYVIEHMKFLEQKYNTKHFVFGDELFNVNRKWVTDFCNKIIEQGHKWVMATGNGLRANCTYEEDLVLMKKAGFYRVSVGIESFYNPTLKSMDKGQTAEQIINAIQAVQKVGIELGSNMMLFGYETDGWESMKENVRASSLLKRFNAGISIPCPYPGTYLYKKVREMGLLDDEEGWLLELSDKDISERVINISKLSDKELFEIIQWGHDQLKINSIRETYPTVAKILDKVQPFLRRRFDLDAFDLLQRIRNGKSWKNTEHRGDLVEEGMNIVNEKGVSLSYENIGDRHLLAEAFKKLDELSKKPLPKSALTFSTSAPTPVEIPQEPLQVSL